MNEKLEKLNRQKTAAVVLCQEKVQIGPMSRKSTN